MWSRYDRMHMIIYFRIFFKHMIKHFTLHVLPVKIPIAGYFTCILIMCLSIFNLDKWLRWRIFTNIVASLLHTHRFNNELHPHACSKCLHNLSCGIFGKPKRLLQNVWKHFSNRKCHKSVSQSVNHSTGEINHIVAETFFFPIVALPFFQT